MLKYTRVGNFAHPRITNLLYIRHFDWFYFWVKSKEAPQLATASQLLKASCASYAKGHAPPALCRSCSRKHGIGSGGQTFICFALSNGVAPQAVMKWIGHPDYKAMRPNIDIIEKTKADAMKQIDDAWGM